METSDLRLAVKTSLSPSELDDVALLVTEARWNQIAADWRIFTDLGTVYAVHGIDSRIVATTATLPYGSRFAWISMVLVAGPFRRRGLATRLMRRAVDELTAVRLVPVLDATPEGRPVYRALGFQDSWGFQRLRRERRAAGHDALSEPQGVTIQRVAHEIWPALCAFDAAAFGADRSAVLAKLRGRLPAVELVALAGDRVVGFCLGRDGRIAAHIGPLVAKDDSIACALIEQALARAEGPIFVDLADTKVQVRAFLENRGFGTVRPFTRMVHGRSDGFDDPASTFAVVGPELG
jgi:GNAT superfamily N-acetyltransferase